MTKIAKTSVSLLLFSRYCRYSINMQVVCDVDKRITAIHVGNPGSCADSTVYKRMAIYKSPQTHFSDKQYLIADSAYGLSQYCVPAYKSPAADVPENKEFNYCLASSRVRNEHCIGILKSRWGSLREMRQQLRNDNDHRAFIDWVVACCVLHNMLARLKDSWGEMALDDEESLRDDDTGPVRDDARNFREQLKPITRETCHRIGRLPMRST